MVLCSHLERLEDGLFLMILLEVAGELAALELERRRLVELGHQGLEGQAEVHLGWKSMQYYRDADVLGDSWLWESSCKKGFNLRI